MKPEKIQIVNLRLPSIQLREIVEALAQEGYASKFCAVRRETGKVGHREVEFQTQGGEK